MPARLGILLSGSGTTYLNLAQAAADGRLPAEIVVVVASRADAGGLERARALGHPTAVAADGAAVERALRAQRAGWVAMCGWMRYWDPPADFRGRVFNIHPSLLPAFGGRGMYGLHVHRAVLVAGVSVSGCTVHLVAGAYDSGPVLAQRQVEILPGDTPEALQARVQAVERELYPQAIAAALRAHPG
jgi:phosphoribosylglycinamide formyltransferase-1